MSVSTGWLTGRSTYSDLTNNRTVPFGVSLVNSNGGHVLVFNEEAMLALALTLRAYPV